MIFYIMNFYVCSHMMTNMMIYNFIHFNHYYKKKNTRPVIIEKKLTVFKRNEDIANEFEYWIENGNFLKISNIQVGYNIPKPLLSTIGITAARAYFAIQNLCTISPYTKYGDPEIGQGSVIYTGLDTGRYATPRTFQFGLNITF